MPKPMRNLVKVKPGQSRPEAPVKRTNWPRLSETLACERRPDQCQGCRSSHELTRWQEHDDADNPEQIIVVLCGVCADVMIEKHPRLYRELHPHEPAPGCMPLCTDCVHCDGVRCTHPDLRANGGNGLALTAPEPIRGFIDYRDRAGRRRGEILMEYRGPVTGCAGREMRGEAIDRQPCGHPMSAIESSDEGTHFCRQCEAEAADEPETPTAANPSRTNPDGAAVSGRVFVNAGEKMNTTDRTTATDGLNHLQERKLL